MSLDQSASPSSSAEPTEGGGAAGFEPLMAVLEVVPAAVAVFDRKRRLVWANARAGELAGGGDLGAVTAEMALLPGFEEQCRRSLAGETCRVEGWVEHPVRGPRFLTRLMVPASTPAGPAVGDGGVVFCQDLSETGGAPGLLLGEGLVRGAAMGWEPDAVIVTDEEGRVIQLNRAAAALFGFEPSAMVGRRVGDLFVPPELRERHLGGIGRHRRGRAGRLIGRPIATEALRADGSRFPLELTLSRIPLGGQEGFIAHIRDLTGDRARESLRDEIACHDPVTGLPNRLQLLGRLGEAMRRGEPATVINFLIDRFASIRTSFGHAFADDLLLGLAGRVVSAVGPRDLLCHSGDHVLTLVLFGRHQTSEVHARIEAISDLLRSAVTPSGAAVFLSASVGVACLLPQHQRPEDLLRDTEIATSRAQEARDSRVVWFDPSMHARVIEQVQIEHDLRAALAHQRELWVAYQPIVELVTGRLAGFEALIRWNHPERGLIPPGHFIGIAEETGLVVALGRWVLHQACRQMAEWQRVRQRGLPELFMSVNLSPRQLEERDLLETVRGILAETGLQPEWLKLEITESAVMRHPEESIVVLSELKKLGLRLSIDDFGTGYSSLSYLHKFPLDSIKVDRSFISAMHLSEDNRSIVRIIVDLARLLGLDVIAEGIETSEDANQLRALACDYAQGYHYARPQPAAAIEPMVRYGPPWLD
jgi:PAS domain S-box-containing protein/diguanylate cyclase (GGDEF)-like protein